MKSDNGYNSANLSVGAHSNLQHKQVYKDQGNYKNQDTYGSKNAYKTDSVYGSKDPYGKDEVYDKDEVLRPKFKRFSDLKILNENMMHMSNNTLSDESRIEILSQGERGEIKNLLSSRILKIAFVPALSSLALGFLLVLSSSFLIGLFGLLVYMGLLVRTFFYPAKLYYENIKFKTTKPANAFFEEMDYWYKISVVNIYVYLIIVSIILFVISFYQDELIEKSIEILSGANGKIRSEKVENFLSAISFGITLKLLAVFNIGVLVMYSKFANKEKEIAEGKLLVRMRAIRNENLSRVQQVQADKNLTD